MRRGTKSAIVVIIIRLQPRDDMSKGPSGGANVGKGPIVFIIAFCLLLFLVLGAIAIGGVALYYAREYLHVMLLRGPIVNKTTN